jgi:hypothetical protein
MIALAFFFSDHLGICKIQLNLLMKEQYQKLDAARDLTDRAGAVGNAWGAISPTDGLDRNTPVLKEQFEFMQKQSILIGKMPVDEWLKDKQNYVNKNPEKGSLTQAAVKQLQETLNNESRRYSDMSTAVQADINVLSQSASTLMQLFTKAMELLFRVLSFIVSAWR